MIRQPFSRSLTWRWGVRPRAVWVAVALTTALGCGKSPTEPSPPVDPYAADRAYCLTETNRYRSMAGAAAVSRSAALDAYADTAARADGTSGTPHGYTNANTPAGRWAENEILRLRLSDFGSVQGVIRAGFAFFWNEGPSGGHYRNMTGAYSQVGCGIFVNGNDVTVVQHFR